MLDLIQNFFVLKYIHGIIILSFEVADLVHVDIKTIIFQRCQECLEFRCNKQKNFLQTIIDNFYS